MLNISGAAVACLRRLPLRQARKISRHIRISHDADIDGVIFRCSTHNNVTERELLLGTRGADDMVLNSVLAALPVGGTFVDIGANIGLMTLFGARKVGPSGRAIAIEPLPPVVERLRFNISRNGFANIDVVTAAVGAEREWAKLYVRAKNHGESSLIALSGFDPVDVPVIPLADIVTERRVTRIDVLKIDIEGFEDRALLPFVRCTDRSFWPRRIVMEIAHRNRWQTDCLASLAAAGYRTVHDNSRDAVLDLS